MRSLIVVALIVSAIAAAISLRRPSAKWNPSSQTWSCPAGYSLYSVESEAIAGRDSAVCVK
jgi:hypothetical protein